MALAECAPLNLCTLYTSARFSCRRICWRICAADTEHAQRAVGCERLAVWAVATRDARLLRAMGEPRASNCEVCATYRNDYEAYNRILTTKAHQMPSTLAT